MALFDTLTAEDLPLSYRFPRWYESTLYPCASVVIFDINPGTADSEVEYHIFVAEKDVNPLQIDPHASVIAMDGNWRDLTGRAITSITSVDSDSATETTVTLTINFDDLTSEDVSFVIPVSAGGGGTADSESVAIFVASDGTLSFGGNLGSDADAAKEAVRSFLCVDFDQVKFEAGFSGTTPGFYANEFVDSEGVGHRVLSATLANNRLFLGTEPFVTPVAPYNPSFSVFILDSTGLNAGADPTLNWDQPVGGFRYDLNNPSDRNGTAFLTPRAIIAGANTLLDTNIDNYDHSSHANSGSVMVPYRTDLNTDQNASIFPFVEPTEQTEDTVSGRGRVIIEFQVTENVSTDSINDDIPGTKPILRLFPMSITRTINWSYPRLDVPTITAQNLRGNNAVNFLETYTTTPFTISHPGLGEVINANHSTELINVNSAVVNPGNTGGTLTFTGANALHKDNLDSERGLRLITEFVRPDTVVGRRITINDSEEGFVPTSGANIPTFTYPSFFASPMAADSGARGSAHTFDPVETDFVQPTTNGSQFITTGTGSDIYDGRVNLFGSEVNDIEAFPAIFDFGNADADRHILMFGFRSSITNIPNMVTINRGLIQTQALPSLVGRANSVNQFTRYTVNLGSSTLTATGGATSNYILEEYTIFAYNIQGMVTSVRVFHQ